jgi:nitrogen regulatory protein PII
MKAVVAFVQPFMVARVVEALHQVSGLSGTTFERARGFGRGRARQHRASDEEDLLGTADRVRVETMVRDELEETVVQAIVLAARTGRKGDGKVYVMPVERAIRIRTGDEGDDAV